MTLLMLGLDECVYRSAFLPFDYPFDSIALRSA
jgi:hypothetical protein